MTRSREPRRLQQPNPNPLKDSWKSLSYIPRFVKEIWKVDKRLFLLHFTARLISAFIPVVLLYIGKLIIDEVVIAAAISKTSTLIWKYIGWELGLALLSDLLNRFIALTDGLLGDKYSYKSSVKIIRKSSALSMAQLEDPAFYDKLERARQQTTGRVMLLSSILEQIQSLISIISLIAGLIYFAPVLIILLILSIIPSFVNEFKFGFKGYSLTRSWTAERRELDYLRYIGANYITAKEIKLFGLTDYIADKFEGLSKEYYELSKKLAISKTIYGSLFNIIGSVSYYGAYVYIIMRTIAGFLTVGDLTFLSGSFLRLRLSLQGFFRRLTSISQSALYLKDYFEFVDLPEPEMNDAGILLPERITKGFELINVSFKYPGAEKPVLEGMTFKIKAGEKMALVGENGAGKTTLIKLLLRFYEPTSGVILLDGIPIQDYQLREYRHRFGVIFQDFFKYDFTARENIAVGNIEELENQFKIESASERSLASEVINDLTDGYDQQLGKRFAQGQDLSGGQWQKFALARAYMKDADIMILDEPTSALDAKAEYEVFERFMNLTIGKTSIIISHRFSTVRMADHILVLKDGRAHELGTHEELLDRDGLYAELFNLQAAGYK